MIRGKDDDDLRVGPHDSCGAVIKGKEELKRSFRIVRGRGVNDDGARRSSGGDVVTAVHFSESTSTSDISGSDEYPTSESRSSCRYGNIK